MSENKVAEVIAMALEGLDDAEPLDSGVDSVAMFREAGVLTSNAGFVLRLCDGSEFQVTVVRSRGGAL